jgi:subtilisin family serine protease
MERTMARYAVLRDLKPATSSPFERSLGLREIVVEAPSEPDIVVEEIRSSSEVLAIAAEPRVRAIARVMPTQLVRPFDSAVSDAGPTAWGVAAVGAAESSRSGTGVTVAVLDTGIDAAHSAFAGVEIAEQDFSGSGTGDRGNLRMFDALMQMIRSRRAFEPGTVLVAAVGNESRRNIDPEYEIGASLPAAAEDVVSVGAFEQSSNELRIAYFSNTFPQIAAPGVDILSAKAGGGLVGLSGTSMAAPHVAGVAALWWEDVFASPLPATSQTVLARLIANATTQGLAPWDDVADRGVGLVRAPS